MTTSGSPHEPRPIVLSSYAAKTCARAIHNAYDSTIEAPPFETPDDLQRLFDMGNEHERLVFEAWAAANNDLVNLLALDGDKAAHIAATIEAMDARVGVILGGRLPDDVEGGRGGKPDILLLDPASGGYHPADVKAHYVLEAGKGVQLSTLESPAYISATEVELAGRKREVDQIQLAHYWRMLEACGRNATLPRGAIVGNDPGGGYVLTWYDLDKPRFKTFSRTAGKRTSRSALERHDHEHSFRVKVARVAAQRTGAADDPAPLVEPLGQKDCVTCAWAPVCVDTLPTGDLSRELRGTLSVREYLALRDQGIVTVADLAAADPEALLTDSYVADTTNVYQRTGRLLKAHVSAQLARDGLVVRLKDDVTVDLPVHAIEIDLDMESARDGRVYLWGALITRDGISEYVEFFDLNTADDASEYVVARRCLDWIAQHPGAAVYHYSHVERSMMKRILGADLDRYAGTASDPDTWIDLLDSTRECMESRDGLGIKVVATEAAGFHWRDEQPGGLESQVWLEQARAGDAKAWQRILTYNEDDVRATLAVRRWLRENCQTPQTH